MPPRAGAFILTVPSGLVLIVYLATPRLQGMLLLCTVGAALFGSQLFSLDVKHLSTTQHGAASFATVHGSGHMVPQFRPQAGARVLTMLLANATYAFAPPLPTDEEIAAMSAAEFDAEIDTWTDTAKAAAD